MTAPFGPQSPFGPQFKYDPGEGGEKLTTGLRSIYDRMTNPEPSDGDVVQRIQQLSYTQIDQILEHFGMVMDYLGKNRDDIDVKRTKTGNTWTIHVEMKPTVPSLVRL